MSHLFQALGQRVDAWRAARYDCPSYPAIREILDFAVEDPATGQLRYLRRAQFRALETYWYLRLVLNTPRIPDLYVSLFPAKSERRAAMGLTSRELTTLIADTSLEEVLDRLRTDNAFVRKHSLESLRETLALDYRLRRSGRAGRYRSAGRSRFSRLSNPPRARSPGTRPWPGAPAPRRS